MRPYLYRGRARRRPCRMRPYLYRGQVRHTCITIMARGGFPSAMLQKHARHARLSTTERYIHLVEDEVSVEAAEFWARRTAASGARGRGRSEAPGRRGRRTPARGRGAGADAVAASLRA
jgi:hypothetical protein